MSAIYGALCSASVVIIRHVHASHAWHIAMGAILSRQQHMRTQVITQHQCIDPDSTLDTYSCMRRQVHNSGAAYLCCSADISTTARMEPTVRPKVMAKAMTGPHCFLQTERVERMALILADDVVGNTVWARQNVVQCNVLHHPCALACPGCKNRTAQGPEVRES